MVNIKTLQQNTEAKEKEDIKQISSNYSNDYNFKISF